MPVIAEGEERNGWEGSRRFWAGIFAVAVMLALLLVWLLVGVLLPMLGWPAVG